MKSRKEIAIISYEEVDALLEQPTKEEIELFDKLHGKATTISNKRMEEPIGRCCSDKEDG